MRRYLVRSFLVILFFGILVSPLMADNFNKGWVFVKGDVDAKAVEFDDDAWGKVTLPHDWAIAGPFSTDNDARTGGLPIVGTGWYRKHFKVDKDLKGKVVSIEFDGAMKNAMVWVNGKFAGERPWGYISFSFDITDHINFGEENVIAVKLNQPDLGQRWYPGSGIYRNVRIKYNDPVHVPQWGTYITTPEVSDSEAVVRIRTKVRNPDGDKDVKLVTRIKDRDGKVVAEVSGKVESAAVDQKITVVKPQRWDIDSPYLYTAVSEVSKSGKVVDEYSTTFGIRTIKFTPNDGFLLNGKRVKFNGVCMHHDLGPLGAAVNYRARERQMEILLGMGINALRTTHNPPEPEWLDICDRLGIVVIVEAFDEWKLGKVKNGYNQIFDKWSERDLRDLIKRDRNHPSVIMWSTGNEIHEQKSEDGAKVAQRLTDICHDEDPTRLVSAGFNEGMDAYKNGIAKAIDIVGFNYHSMRYADARKKDPNVMIVGSETSSQTSSRGVYHLPITGKMRRKTGQITSYDTITGTVWTYPPDIEFMQQKKNPFVMGEFLWTGFDYLGEPTPFGWKMGLPDGAKWNADWPSHSSYFGPVDLVGLPKDRFYLYQSQWAKKPMVHVLPHWNWEGSEHKEIPVFAYSNAEEVELFVNGKSQGVRVKGKDKTPVPIDCWGYKGTYQSPYRMSWKVAYEPGTIKVVARTGGKVVAEKEVKTAGEPAAIKLEADRKKIKADGLDMSFVTVTIVDKNGIPCPRADNVVEFNVKGKGFNAGVGNGDALCVLSMKGNEMAAFSGKLMLYVQAAESRGKIKISAKADGLKSSKLVIKAGK